MGMKILAYITSQMVERPLPSAGVTTGSSLYFAWVSFFERSIIVVQWIAGVGAIACTALTALIALYTLSEKRYQKARRIAEEMERAAQEDQTGGDGE